MKTGAGTIGAWQTITLAGQLTIKNLTLVRRYLERAEENPFPGVMIDMAEVTQLDSSGITLLVNFQKRISQRGGTVVIAGLTSDIAEIFSIVGIDRLFQLCGSRDEFIRQFCI